MSVAYVGGPTPYTYDNGAYAYDYDNDNEYGNEYVACGPSVRYDNNGGKQIGAVLGGVLGKRTARVTDAPPRPSPVRRSATASARASMTTDATAIAVATETKGRGGLVRTSQPG